MLFVNEEPPYSHTPDMGSYRYAELLAERGEKVIGMISLETLGCFFEQPGTQKYPLPFGLIYPHTGNFIAFVGLTSSALAQIPARGDPLVPQPHGVSHHRRRRAGLHSRHFLVGPLVVRAVPLSRPDDHRHRAVSLPALPPVTDTPDKVDVDKLARITRGLERVVRELA